MQFHCCRSIVFLFSIRVIFGGIYLILHGIFNDRSDMCFYFILGSEYSTCQKMGKTLSTLSFTELAATCTLAACFPPLLLYATHRYRNRELYKIPGLYDWPIVGDVLHLSPNPAGIVEYLL